MDILTDILDFLADIFLVKKRWRFFGIIVTLAAIGLGTLFALIQLGYL